MRLKKLKRSKLHDLLVSKAMLLTYWAKEALVDNVKIGVFKLLFFPKAVLTDRWSQNRSGPQRKDYRNEARNEMHFTYLASAAPPESLFRHHSAAQVRSFLSKWKSVHRRNLSSCSAWQAEMLTTILPRTWLTRVGKENTKRPTQTTLAKQPTSCECFLWGQTAEAKFYIPWLSFIRVWGSKNDRVQQQQQLQQLQQQQQQQTRQVRMLQSENFLEQIKSHPSDTFFYFFNPWNFDLDQKCQKQLFSQKWRPEKL